MILNGFSKVYNLAVIQEKKYGKGSVIDMYNLYDDIEKVPSLDEIMKMDIEAGKKIIEAVRKKHQVKKLCKHWGKSDNYLYVKVFPHFNVQTRNYKDNIRKNKNKSISPMVQDIPEIEKIMEKQRAEIVQAAVMVKNGVAEILNRLETDSGDGQVLKLKGEFKGKNLSERLLGLAGILIEQSKYKAFLVIQEVIEDTEDSENG